MQYQLTGVIKVVKETLQVTEKFSKREFVVTSDPTGAYPQDIQFQAAQDKCSILDGFPVGTEVTVSFNLRGREWTSPQSEVKYFNTLDAWRVERAAVQTQAPNNVPQPMVAQPAAQPMAQPAAVAQPGAVSSDAFLSGGDDDDLPF